MFKITDSLTKFYTETKSYMSSKDRKHSDNIIVCVTLSALGATALLGGTAAGKQCPKLAVSVTLGGVASTVLYGLHQLYLRQIQN